MSDPILDFGAVKVALSGLTGNVKGFGAKGDGATDDTAAIQAAINAVPATGGIVFFPPGNYLRSSTAAIALRSNLVLCSPAGACITSTGTANLFEASNISNVVIDGLTFLGPGDNDSSMVVNAANLDRFTVTNVYASGFASFANLSSGCTNVLIKDSVFRQNRLSGISGINVSGIIVTNNRFEENGYSSATHGIYIAGVTRGIIANNRFRSNAGYAVHIYHSGASEVTENLAIIANIFSDDGATYGGGAIQVAGVGTRKNVEVSGNVIAGCYNGIAVLDVEGLLIQGNVITGVIGSYSLSLSSGSGSARDYSVVGNIIVQGAGNAIQIGYLSVATWKTLISQNIIVGNANGIVIRTGYPASNHQNIAIIGNAINNTANNIATDFYSQAGNVIKSNPGVGRETANITVVNGGASYTPDASIGPDQIVRVVMDQAITINNPVNAYPGAKIGFVFYQNATGGYSVSWGSNFLVTWTNTGNDPYTRSSIEFVHDGAKWQQIGAQSSWQA